MVERRGGIAKTNLKNVRGDIHITLKGIVEVVFWMERSCFAQNFCQHIKALYIDDLLGIVFVHGIAIHNVNDVSLEHRYTTPLHESLIFPLNGTPKGLVKNSPRNGRNGLV